MNKQVSTVPKLRFPEFVKEGEWENLLLGDVYSFKVTNSFSREKLNYKKGLVKNIHYGDIHTKFSTLFDITKELVPFIDPNQKIENINPDSYCIEGDMIFADASEDMNDVGKSIEIVNLNNEKLLSGLHTLLARQKETILVIGFGGYLFKSNNIRFQIQKEAQGAKVASISYRRLSNIKIAIPSQLKEQQKIADCLSSLDALITTQTQKLTALQQHKKGLMQNLFPTEGKTTPKLRFPEFVDDWRKIKLSDILDVKSSQIAKNELQFLKSGYPIYGAGGILGLINSYDKECDYIAIIKDGSGVGNLFFYKGKSSLIGTLNYLISKNDKNFKLKWLYYLLQTIDFSSFIKGAGIPHIYYKDYSKLIISIPRPKEQQKIADCLSFLDALITIQTQKLQALQQHKKGLMQQLFPATDEVDI